jgi:hypothetical protein
LRSQFERRFGYMSDKYAGNPNKSLDFLFYGQDSKYPSIFENLPEEGYPDIIKRDQMSIPKYVPVTNSIFSADSPRIQAFYRKSQANLKKPEEKEKGELPESFQN